MKHHALNASHAPFGLISGSHISKVNSANDEGHCYSCLTLVVSLTVFSFIMAISYYFVVS